VTDEPTTKAHAFAVRLGDTLEVALREIGAMSDDELAAGLAEFVLCTGLVAPAMPAKLCDIVQSIHVEAVPQ
jgi:hypothetical protein